MQRETARLHLRQWSEKYFDRYAEIYADATLARYIGGQMDRPSAWRRMASEAGHWVLRGFGTWAVVEKATGRFVGSVGLWKPEGWPELEMGYWLAPEARGTGFATEAGAASLQFAFEDLGAETVVSYIDPTNEPSKRVAERLGGRYEETIELLKLGAHCVYRYSEPPSAN
ncbi:MAG: GNAT family N-acetyltransferase [Xanthomonadales bacterium]|nr:GNAT family N-acetyltransferase [Xanthomonadales bacterium]